MPHHKRHRPKHQRAGGSSKGKAAKDEREARTAAPGGDARREAASAADFLDERDVSELLAVDDAALAAFRDRRAVARVKEKSLTKYDR